MSDAKIRAQLLAAHIPPYALTTNFEITGLTALRSRVTSRAVLDAADPVNFYLYADTDTKANMRSVSIAVGLVAKALCLHGKKIIHVNLAGMLREQRFAEMEREPRSFNPVMERVGQGYIAISDFLEFADVEQKYGYHAVQLVADHLIEHVERGGGLILGATNIAQSDATQYGAAFSALMLTVESYRI